MAAVFLPVGFAALYWHRAALAGLVVALVLASGPVGTGLLPATALDIAGAVLGIGVGTLVSRLVRRSESSGVASEQ
jgi:Na+/proline symporter